MIRVGIVEDDPHSASLLVEYIRRFEREHGDGIQVVRFADGAQVVAGYGPGFDILFMDVEMPELDGFSAAEEIRRVDADVVIVFITNMAHDAIKGYQVDALNFMAKPVSYFAFSQELRRSITRTLRRPAEYIPVAVDDGLVRVAMRDLVYLETARHRSIFHTVDGKHSVLGALKTFEIQFEGKGFFRIGSGYLVNLRNVLGVSGSRCFMLGGKELPISRSRKKAFLAALTDYLGSRSS